MRYIRKQNGQMEERSASPFMGASWYAANGYLAYVGNRLLTQLDIIDGTIIELPEPEPAKTPRILSKLKIRDKLTELGLWEPLRAALETAGEYERWYLAHDVCDTEPVFAALCEQLRPQLVAAGIDLEAILNECIMEPY